MAETKTLSLIWDGSNGTAQLKLNFESTYDESTNKSLLKLTSMQMKNPPTIGYPYYLDGVLEINGQAILTASHVTAQYYATCNSSDTWYDVRNLNTVATAELEISHDIDGGKSVVVRLVGRLGRDDYNGSGGYDAFTIGDLSSGTPSRLWTVGGDQNLSITEPWRGLVYIDDGESFNGYQVYIDNGTSWDLYIPYVDNGTSWDICS